MFSLQDSRFGSLAAYPTSAAGPGGSQQGGAGGSLDEEAGSSQQGGAGGSQQGGAGSSVNGTAVGSSAAESDNEAEEGQEGQYNDPSTFHYTCKLLFSTPHIKLESLLEHSLLYAATPWSLLANHIKRFSQCICAADVLM